MKSFKNFIEEITKTESNLVENQEVDAIELMNRWRRDAKERGEVILEPYDTEADLSASSATVGFDGRAMADAIRTRASFSLPSGVVSYPLGWKRIFPDANPQNVKAGSPLDPRGQEFFQYVKNLQKFGNIYGKNSKRRFKDPLGIKAIGKAASNIHDINTGERELPMDEKDIENKDRDTLLDLDREAEEIHRKIKATEIA